MKNIVIDINIFMDFLFKRDGHEKAAKVFGLCAEGVFKGCVCAHEITTLHYFLAKSVKEKGKVRKVLSGIMKRFCVIDVGGEILERALYSDIGDFEDAVIDVSAAKNGADYILTRNIKDFAKGAVKAVTPDELLAFLQERR